MTAERNDGGPAFAYEHKEWDADDREWRTHFIHPGMSLRDYFAAAALQGMLAAVEDKSDMDPTYVATAAYVWADKMLKARQA